VNNLDKPLISIIVNCHNGEEYLSLALESILKQTYSNWELIFFDNKSSDNSVKIIEGKDPRIKIFKSNLFISLYEARNEAIEFCNGNAITFLDTDDIWIENKLEIQVSSFLEGNKFIYGDYHQINENNNLINKITPNPSKCTNELLIRNTISIGCVMIETELLKGEKFDPFYNLLGDFDLWVRLSQKNGITHLPFVLEHSRVHSNNLSDQLNSSWKIERRYFYKKYLSKLSLIFKTPAIMKYVLITEVKGILNKR
jgi:glycosyltransferase involved in cell wall biosynthesis